MLSLSGSTSDAQKNALSVSKNLYDAKNEREIWMALKKGDKEAFIHIYSRYFPILFNYGHQFTKDRELVKDLIQDLFIKLKTNPGKLSDTDSIRYYLFKALRRSIVKCLKKQNRLSLGDEITDSFDIAISHEKLLIENQQQKEVKEQIKNAINQLTARQREAVLYYYYEGFTYEQIASIMGFSKVEYARTLIYRALDKIRSEIKYLRNTIFFCLSFFFL